MVINLYNLIDMRKAEISIDLTLYNDAMQLCLYDREWYAIAKEQKENLFETIKIVTGDLSEIATNKYLLNKDIAELMKYKCANQLDEQSLGFFFDTESDASVKYLTSVIKTKTEFNAAVVKNLLQEYCDNTRDIFHATISPFPETPLDTTKSMKKFKVVINEDKYFILELSGQTLICRQHLENISQLNEYFETRATSKRICRGYFSKNDLPEEIVIEAQQKLNYLKECILPINFARKTESDYKIVYKEYQVCHCQDKDFTIDGKRLKISYIDRFKK